MSHRSFFFIVSMVFLSVCTAKAATDGVLTVKTQPEGVEVWLGDQYIGDTPVMEKRLKPGRYSVKLIDAVRHTSSIEEVFIQAGETTMIEKTMKNKFGSLNVNSKPEGAEVYVLLPLGKTPLSNDFMKPGKYRLEVRHPNSLYQEASEDITISEGEKVDISQTLEARNVFNKKALLRIGLGVVSVAGFVYAAYEHGMVKEFEKADDIRNKEYKELNIGKDYDDDIQMSKIKRALGIVVGALGVVGFEVVAFF